MAELQGGDERPRICDEESLRRWLDASPSYRQRQSAVVIAVRAALRVLPLIAQEVDDLRVAPTSRRFEKLPLPIFWGNASARMAAIRATVNGHRGVESAITLATTGTYAPSATHAAAAASHAVLADTDAAARASSYAASAVSYAASAVSFAATSAPLAARAEIWSSTSADAAAIDEGRPPSDLAGDPLWPHGAPEWAKDRWSRLRELLAEAHWRPWLEWYQRRLDGVELSEEIELPFATVPIDPLEKPPAEQNALLAKEIEQRMVHTSSKQSKRDFSIHITEAAHKAALELSQARIHEIPGESLAKIAAAVVIAQRPDADSSEPTTTSATRERFDFFLSYSNKNDAFARFVDDVLCKAGYRVFAQWRDIPVGSNFVHEMNKGLSRSERLVALLSPDYVASEHAMSELASAYNDDADGSKRKIIPFIIAPVDPPPLYQQIVWRQIFSLSRDDAAKAILTAVGFEGVVTPGEAWPGAQTLDAMTRESSEWYLVAPDAQGVIRRKHAARAEGLREKEGYDAAELYAQMRREIEKIREHVCDSQGGGNFSFSPRLQKRLRRLAVETPEDIQKCSPLALDEALKDVLRVLGLDEKEGALPPHDEIGHFSVDLNGHYQLLAALFPSLRQYRKQGARRRYKRPPPEALAAFSIIPSVAKNAADIIDKDLASDLAATGVAIEVANDASLGAQDDARDAEADAHLRAAAQVTPLWNWLSNPREKFARLGVAVKDLPEVIEKYDKAYERLAKAKPYVQWLLSWWF